MPFAAIYVPDFPVEAMVRAEPELREQAVAVVEGTPPLVHVVAVNERAAQAGVEPGMTRLQAEERMKAAVASHQSPGKFTAGEGDRGGSDSGHIKSSPGEAPEPTKSKVKLSQQHGPMRGSVLRQRSAERETAAHAALLDCACGFSPRVEDMAADTVVLDLAGLERIFGPPAKMARDVARRCSEMGLEVNVAVASNTDTAALAARGLAGVTVIAEGKEAERLGELSVEVLIAVDWGKALPMNVSINLSTRDLMDATLPDRFAALLQRHRCAAQWIALEITESAILDDPAHAIKNLERLHALGCRLAIDDYGTGYASLTYLRNLRAQQVKLDRTFTAGIPGDQASEAIVRSTIELAHTLGATVVAEGVETPQQWHHLASLGCDIAQGYLIGRPLPAGELAQRLTNKPALRVVAA